MNKSTQHKFADLIDSGITVYMRKNAASTSDLLTEMANESASTQRDFSTIGLSDLPSAMRALGLLQEREVAERTKEASTSTDWLQRAAATLSDHVQPWVLRRLFDDEVDIVKQLAIGRLKKLESSKQSAGVAVP